MLHVVLDPCCGINVKNHRSPIWDNMTQLYEWKFNRKIVNKIKSCLKRKNIPVHILSETNNLVPLIDKIGSTYAVDTNLKSPTSKSGQ